MAKTVWEEEADSRWPQYEGDLDAALSSLREGDRKAVMLRFYEHKSFDEIAHILGTAEEAARKRVSRAVEKLRGYFGVSSRVMPASVVTYYLYSKLSTAAPEGLALKIASAASAAQGGAVAPGAAELARHVAQHIAIVKAKWVATGIAAALLLSVGTGVVVFNALGNQQPSSNQSQPVQNDYRVR